MPGGPVHLRHGCCRLFQDVPRFPASNRDLALTIRAGGKPRNRDGNPSTSTYVIRAGKGRGVERIGI